MRPPRDVAAALLASGALIAMTGCGGGSDKPDYCTDRAALQQTVKSLTSLDPSAGLSGLQTSLQTIQSEVTRLVASAQSDFPDETAAVRSSFTKLSTDVRALPSSPTPAQLKTLAADAATAVGAIRAFSDASRSACD